MWKKIKPIVAIAFVAFLFAFPFVALPLFRQYAIFVSGVLGYATAFGIGVVTNASIILPTPSTFPVVVEIAHHEILILLTLVYGVASALGEGTAYLVGDLGNSISLVRKSNTHKFLAQQMKGGRFRIGIVLFVLAVQPLLPFDVGGIMAGNAGYPRRWFFVSTALGRWLKYFYLIEFWDVFNRYILSRVGWVEAVAPYAIMVIFFIVLLYFERETVKGVVESVRQKWHLHISF